MNRDKTLSRVEISIYVLNTCSDLYGLQDSSSIEGASGSMPYDELVIFVESRDLLLFGRFLVFYKPMKTQGEVLMQRGGAHALTCLDRTGPIMR